jgi:threonine/homoserine/homoserine lactone efflux protein
MRPSVVVLIVGFLLTFLVLGAAAIADRRGRRDQVRVFQRLSFGVMAITGVAVIVVAWVD